MEIRQQIYDLQMEQIRQMTIASTSSLSTENISLIENDTPRHIPRHAHHFLSNTVSSLNHTLPRKVSSKRSNKTTYDRDLSTGSSCRRQARNYVTQNRKRMSFYDNANKPIFISKCICFVTRTPIVYSVENLLRSLYAMICNKFLYLSSLIVPLESFLYWSLHEVFFKLNFYFLILFLGTFTFARNVPSSFLWRMQFNCKTS